MNDTAQPNLLLEALAYLGARANGNSINHLESQLMNHGVYELDTFRRRSASLCQLIQRIDQEVTLSDDQLHRLFGNLAGFPRSTIGSYSPVFLLLYPMLNLYNGNFDKLLEQTIVLSPEHTARHLLLSLDLADQLKPGCEDCSDLFIDSILSQDVPAESRLAILELQRNYSAVLKEAGECIRPVLTVLERCSTLLQELSSHFCWELESLGPEAYLHETSSLDPSDLTHYRLHPLILGPDTNLSLVSFASSDSTDIYCGILRLLLHRLLASAEEDINQVFEMIRILGDKTRFSILCYLNGRSAYGQELSEQFDLARNTIHHHMTKLLNAGLVTCTVSGNRVYYTANREQLDRLLSCQRKLLVEPREAIE